MSLLYRDAGALSLFEAQSIPEGRKQPGNSRDQRLICHRRPAMHVAGVTTKQQRCTYDPLVAQLTRVRGASA